MESLTLPRGELVARFAHDLKLKDVIVKLEEIVRAEGKVVCGIKVNGMQFSEIDESRFALAGLDEIEEIELQIEKIESLVDESLRSLRDYVFSLKEMSISTADRFREGLTPEAQKLFIETATAVQRLTDALAALKPNLKRRRSADMDMKSVEKSIEAWSEAETHMIQTVRELMLAYEKQDFTLVSDVLEYEVYTSLEKWLDIIHREIGISGSIQSE